MLSQVEPGQGGRRSDREPVALRRVRHANALAEVIDVRIPAEAPPPRGHSADYQVVLTYLGLFGYCVGSQTSFFDVNQTLFATKDQEFTDSHPVEGLGHGSLVVTPGPELREHLFGSASPGRHLAFLAASAPSSPRLRVMTHLLRTLRPGAGDTLRADEAIVSALEQAVPRPSALGSGRPSRVVDRAKQLMHARITRPLSLEPFAREVGCSAAYLTREFTRVEGRPLYRYQLDLRLNEALLQLPHCESITGLALDLGFSSHAHMTAAFSAAFAVTPSQYRADARSRRPTVSLPRRQAA